MNESEYITDVETAEEYISEDSSESDFASVTTVNDTGSDDISSVSEVSETAENTTSFVSSVDNLAVIANNTSGILLMITAIFFAIVIAYITKLFGGYFSM